MIRKKNGGRCQTSQVALSSVPVVGLLFVGCFSAVLLFFIFYGEQWLLPTSSEEPSLPPFEEVSEILFQSGEKTSRRIRFHCGDRALCPVLDGYAGILLASDWFSQIKQGYQQVRPLSDGVGQNWREAFGVQSASAFLFVSQREGKRGVLFLGRENAYLKGRYGALTMVGSPFTEEELFLKREELLEQSAPLFIPAPFLELFSAPLNEILQSSVLNIPSLAERVRSLTVSLPDGKTLLLSKKEPPEVAEGTMDSGAPSPAPWSVNGKAADEPFVRELLTALSSLRFEEVLSPDEAPFSWSSKAQEFVLQYQPAEADTREGETTEVLILQPSADDDTYWAKRGSLSSLFRIRTVPRSITDVREEHFLPVR
ncbi:hypothetical protein MRY87_04165 [bacterium]|nr:hypothetical protein [bacterium]